MLLTSSAEFSQDDISSPIAAHILDFCDDGSGGDLFAAVNVASDMFTAASSEDASSSSVTTSQAPCSHGDNVSSGTMAAASAFSPMPSLDSTLSALLEEDDPSVPDTELLLPIDYQFAAAVAGDEPHQPEQGQLPVALPVAGVAEQPALQTQMSSTASELMQLASSGYTDECFAAAIAGGGGYMGLEEVLCQQQQPPQPGALLPAGVMENTAVQGCLFSKDAAAAVQGGGFFGTTGCTGMVMSMMGMEEIGEYQRMMESASAALAATHSPDADSSAAAAAQMAFAGNAAGEMQVE